MGVDLSGKDSSFTFNWQGWRETLALAHSYGWEPEGAVASVMVEQVATDGGSHTVLDHDNSAQRIGYFSNDYQLVTDTDAAAIADALQRAVDDMPELLSRSGVFSGRMEYVREFITFCRKGGFLIG